MDVNLLSARIETLQQAVESSAANHNGLVGRLLEARELLSSLVNPSEGVEAAVIDVCEEVREGVAEFDVAVAE